MKTLLTVIFIFISAAIFAQTGFHVNFDFNKYSLAPEATSKLDSFLSAKKNSVQIRIYGYCDNIGSDRYNDILSDRRTDAVKTYLVQKGFNDDDILEEKGFGKRDPLNENITALERYLNRRVEVEIFTKEVKTVSIEKAPDVSLTQKIEDTASKPGTLIELKNLNFYGGLHHILPQSVSVVQELIDVMKKNPTLIISIEGHICCQYGPGDGLDIETKTVNLSENRAKAIYDLLVQNGIDNKRLSYKGFGHQFPLTAFPEKTKEEQSDNRRVEIKIVKR